MPVLFLFLIALKAPVESAQIVFAPPVRYDLNTPPVQQYAAGTIWQGLTSADLNDDGRSDIAMNTFDGVAVLLNSSSGTLASPVKYALKDGPPHTTLIAQDLNGDRRPELIASGWFLSNTRFAVLMNNGDGTFATPAYYSGGAGGSLAIGNFFGDGRMHLALLGGTNIIVYRSNGDGTFTAGPSMDLLRERAGTLTASDLNNDGFTDLITTLGFAPISVLINLGNGTFSEPTSYPTSRTGVVVAADVDNDGDADLITPMIDTGQVGVMLNSGGGVFATPVFYATGLIGTNPAVSALDVDGDGYLDLAALGLGDPVVGGVVGHVGVLRNNRDGTFAAPVDLLTGGRSFPGSIIHTDFDRDGRSDLIASYYQQNPNQTYIQVIRNLTPQGSNTLRIDRILPNRGGNSGTVTASIFGRSLLTDVQVKLTATGQPDIVGSNTTLQSGSFLTTRFDLTGAARGVRDVVVINPDSTTARLAGGFTIEASGAPAVWVDVIGRSVIRGGRSQIYYVQYGNRGNIDAYDQIVWVSIPTFMNWKIPNGQPLPSASGETDEGDTLLAFDLSLITAAGTGVIPLNLIAPSDPEFGHKQFDIQAWLDETDFVSNEIESASASVGPSDIFTLNSLDSCPSPATCLPPRSNCTILDPREFLVRNRLSLAGIEINKCPCLFPDDTDCTDVKGLQDSTIEKLVLLKLEWGCPLLITGGTEKSSHSKFGGHHQGLKIDICPTGCVSTKICSSYSQICPRYQKDLCNPGKTYKVPQWQGSSGIVFAREKCREHWDIDFSGFSNSCPQKLRKTVEIIIPNDPNDKIGSQGVGVGRWLSGDEPLRYSIFFENKPTATALAQDVVVTDQLDRVELDLPTLNLGPITFLDKIVIPPHNIPLAVTGQFNTDVDLRPANNIIVRIDATLNQNTNVLTWRFTSIDPDTGQAPEDPRAGFLPPGAEGSVFFTVMPKNGLSTGTPIRNKATIVFDVNPPLDTPEWFNTIDNTKPTSHVLPLAATQTSTSFNVQWAGADEGSGVRDFKVYVSDNGGPFTPWLTHTTSTQATFPGVTDHTYAFFSVARDLTNNVEDVKTVAEATTRVVTNRSPIARGKNITLTASNSCQASISPIDVDDGSFDPDGDTVVLTLAPAGLLGLGTHAVVLTATDANGTSDSASATITVVDQTRPTITNVSVNPSIIWPPNRRMVDVLVGYDAADNCGQTISSLSVHSNEPLTPTDVEIVDAHRLRLRADRRGGGGGRTYRITIFVMDGYGNSSSKDVLIRMRHDQRR